MSKYLDTTGTCPNCGEKVNLRVWQSVNAELDPDVARQVVDGSLFSAECEHCGKTALLQYTMLFHDMQRHNMCWFIDNPDALSDSDFEAMNVAISPLLNIGQEYQLRFTAKLDTMRELACIWISGLDDPAVLVSKSVLAALLKKNEGALVSDAIFVGVQDSGDLLFRITGENLQGEMANFPRALYEHNVEEIEPFCDQVFPPNEWVGWHTEQSTKLLSLVNSSKEQ